jgi:hypothetical protein
VCSQEQVFILEHYFALKYIVAVHEAFNNAYPEKEVPNKTNNTPTGYNIWGHRECLSVTSAHRMTNGCNYGRTDFKQCISSKNSIRLQEFNIDIVFLRFIRKGVNE